MRLFLFFSLLSIQLAAQQLPLNRQSDWHKDLFEAPNFDTLINIMDYGAIADGSSPNDSAWNAAIGAVAGLSAEIYFPPGQYFFQQSLNLDNNQGILGAGMNQSNLIFDLGGSPNHCINISGQLNSDSSVVTAPISKGDSSLQVYSSQGFQVGDWIEIRQNDSALVTSSWALNSVGQLLQIKAIQNNELSFHRMIRMDYPLSVNPYLIKFTPKQKISLNCFKIQRQDATAAQTSNINLNYATNVLIKGIESEQCNFAHITLAHAAQVHIQGVYLHEAFSYGGGGKGYGVVFQFTTGDSWLSNSIFQTLRHAVLFQAGSNGNVVAYNYSMTPFRTEIPNDLSGDLALHGNYPYLNLIEGNIFQNIIIDNSHGPNGPFNTFFRNRAELYGLIILASNSPDQNFIANEITATAAFQGNYLLNGTGHFEYGNNHQGSIVPNANDLVTDFSYAYLQRPVYQPLQYWAGIGLPNLLEEQNNFAKQRWDLGLIEEQICLTTLSPEVSFIDSVIFVQEPISDSLIWIPVNIQNIQPDSCSVDVLQSINSTASPGIDFDFTPSNLLWVDNADSLQYIPVLLKADQSNEAVEFFELELSNFNNLIAGDFPLLRIYIQEAAVSSTVSKPTAPINLFPNPSTGLFQLHSTEPLNSLQVYNSYGQRLLHTAINHQECLIDLRNYPAGIYNAIIITHQGPQHFQLVKQ